MGMALALGGNALAQQAYTPPPFHAEAAPSFDTGPGTGSGGAERLSPEEKTTLQAGVVALGKNQFEHAEAAFLKLLNLAPESPTALIDLGLIEFRLGRAEKAQGYLQRAIRVQPDAALAWMMLGVIAINDDERDAATAYLAQAVYLNPKSPQAHNYYAVILAKRGWYDAAEDELRTVVSLAPDFAEAQFNLALVYFERNPPAVELARRHYQKALDLGAAPDPSFAAKLNAAPEQTLAQ
jgi:Flp pilus assembly protein TadD